jgi:hypothetical protein
MIQTDQKLTLQAFQTAVDTYRQRGLDLPERIAAIADTLETHIDELDSLSEIDPTFEMIYEAVGSALYNSSQRAKLLNPPETTRPHSNGFHTTSNGNSSTTQPPKTNGHHQTAEPIEPTHQPTIYRYTLPHSATIQETNAFQQQVEAIRQANPDWVISFDRPQPGESDAIVMIHKDHDYPTTHAAYIANRTINDVVAPTLSRIFGQQF